MALTTAPVELVSLDGTVTINDSSADVDFRVESNGNQHMLFVDAGNDRVSIKTGTAINSSTLSVAGSIAFDGQSVGTYNDASGWIDFTSTSNTNLMRLHSGGDSGESSQIEISTVVSGSQSDAITVESGGTIVINQDSNAARDFRVESDGNANMLFVDAGNDRVLIGTTASRSLSGVIPNLLKEGTGYNDSAMALVGNTGTTAAIAPLLLFGRSRGTSNGTSTSVASGDRLGGIFFTGADGTDIESLAAVIQAKVDGTPGSNDMPGRLEFYTTPDGSETTVERMRIHSGGVVSISEGVELGNSFNGAASNTLDDYEEGSWTPVMISGGSTNPTGGGALSPGGWYQKVGNTVTVTFYVGRSYTNSPNGSIMVSGLPFTLNSTATTAYNPVSTYRVTFGDQHIPFVIPTANNTNFGLYSASNGGGWFAMTWQDHANSAGTYVAGQFSYIV